LPFPDDYKSPGRPPSVWAGQADVSERLLDKYTPDEIIALAGDTKRMSKELSSFQAIILIQLANALSARDNNDNALERERLLDRVVGKPVSRTELTGKNGAPLQINVITGVNAVDAEFVEVVTDAIEDQREPSSSLDETRHQTPKTKNKHVPPDGWEARADAAQAKLEVRRAYKREYHRKRRARLNTDKLNTDNTDGQSMADTKPDDLPKNL